MAALIEPFFYCLLASLIWAPAVFIAASILAGDKKNRLTASALSGKIWPAALIIAALPVLLAPVAAALGLSLRSPEPLPPMAEAAGPAIAATEPALPPVYEAPRTVSIADILRMTAILYFYGFLMLLVLAAVRHIWFAYRLNYAFRLDEPRLEAELENWRMRIGVTQRPRYVFSHVVSSVCVYGLFRPVIVMPMHLLDRVPVEDAALMGAHEMAHIKRGDVALFLLCSVAKAVFWFNPFMHQICNRANLAAEQGADALVLARGVNRRQYAHCFVQGLRLAADARSGFAGDLVPSFTPFDKRSRRQRLDAILSGSRETGVLSLTSKIGLAAGAVAASGLAFAQAALAVAPPEPRLALTVAPVKGEITSEFGVKRTIMGEALPAHDGIDIRAPRGEPVRAAGDGKVLEATDRYNNNDAWGKVVVIDHGHGLITRYAHLDSYVARKGERVGAGEIIGAVGSTGKATGPHLHFEVIADGEIIDPAPVVAPAPAAPKARATMKREVQLAPAPTNLAPLAPVAPTAKASASASSSFSASASASASASSESRRDRADERKLEQKMQKLEERLRKQFEKFDAFEGLEDMTIRFGDVDLDGFDGAEEWAKALENSQVELKELSNFAFVTPDMSGLDGEEFLSREELEEIRRDAREDAIEAAADAMEEMRDRFEEQRDERREAMQEEREAARERAREQKERERELKRERKRFNAEMKRMRQEAERDIAEAEREWAYRYNDIPDEREMLEQQEQALRNAKESLELQLSEIERRRKELNKSE
ncbi:M23/M56 family metallopeptidase [Hyphococcus sp.]|uniref:M23/M56 family metallopeptidase n=1 Tax=Hyphococcus sp. TaxID=2038636 RepID=UPI0035C6CD17